MKVPRSASVAAVIYDDAVQRAMKDHKAMIRKFMRGKIPIASPSGMDREREYVIEAFDRALSEKFAGKLK
jgi:hypothetical protein